MTIPYGKGEFDEDGYPVGSLLKSMFNGSWLDAQRFAELAQIVMGLVVEGLTILVGPPKVGKSWLVGNIAIACAYGGIALGAIPVDRRPVLYLALEDGPRRLQHRLRKLSGGRPLPAELDMICVVEPGAVLGTIAEWLELHRDSAPLVIVDTLGKARPQRRPGADPYLEDYAAGTKLKRLVDEVPGSALLVVHHTNKGASDDFVDAVSGTQGIAGAADSVLVLRRARKSNDATLAVTGRDITEREVALVVEDGIWRLDGNGIEEATERAEQRQQRGALGDQSLDILAAVIAAGKPVRASDIAAATGVHPDHVRKYLKRLADSGRITRCGRGLYGGVPSVPSVPNPPENGTVGTDVTPLFPRS
ncbi:AAA family ATPase [Gordonia paraffinivorans]|uniref:AAA family ATPase n=1 Tax=Gordonia paraffinivorans TaxID=175628 RepID=UPI0014472FB5|nr:AAA family ATPase [Gordonia paraffinivorans]